MDDLISRQAAIDAVNAYLGLSAASRTIQNMTNLQEILENLPAAQPEIIRCKDCKNRGVVNVCPRSGYILVGKKTNRGTDSSSVPFDYGTKLQTYCNAKDDDFCSRAERKEDE